MAKHEVICYYCNRRFDESADKDSYPLKNRRYVCGSCARKAKEEREARAKENKLAERERTTGTRQSVTGMIIKIVVGVLFILSSFTFIAEGNIGYFLGGVAIGAALVAWGAIPYMKVRKFREQSHEE